MTPHQIIQQFQSRGLTLEVEYRSIPTPDGAQPLPFIYVTGGVLFSRDWETLRRHKPAIVPILEDGGHFCNTASDVVTSKSVLCVVDTQKPRKRRRERKPGARAKRPNAATEEERRQRLNERNLAYYYRNRASGKPIRSTWTKAQDELLVAYWPKTQMPTGRKPKTGSWGEAPSAARKELLEKLAQHGAARSWRSCEARAARLKVMDETLLNRPPMPPHAPRQPKPRPGIWTRAEDVILLRYADRVGAAGGTITQRKAARQEMLLKLLKIGSARTWMACETRLSRLEKPRSKREANREGAKRYRASKKAARITP